jgi:hypothetical protein
VAVLKKLITLLIDISIMLLPSLNSAILRINMIYNKNILIMILLFLILLRFSKIYQWVDGSQLYFDHRESNYPSVLDFDYNLP